MSRLSPVLRFTVLIAFGLAIAPVVAQCFVALAETSGMHDSRQPWHTTQLAALAGLPWSMPALLFLAGLTIGIWTDWWLRKFDNIRRRARKSFGVRLIRLADEIARLEFNYGAKSNGSPEWPRNLGRERRTIDLALARMHKFGIWNPGRVAFQIPRGGEFLVDFFRDIGKLLASERFDQARSHARAAQLRFELIGRR